MKRLNWQNIRLVLLLILLVFLYSFALHRNQQRKIDNIRIDFQGDSKMFLTHQMVNNLLIQNLKQSSTFKKEQLDLKYLESVLQKHPFIEKAEVFTSEDGMLITKIKQRSPIARVVNDNRNFYVDKNGSVFEMSDVYSARVPLVKGNLNGYFKKGFVKTFRAIDEDDFLKKNIIAVEIFDNGSMKMLTRSHDYEIMFGRPVLIDKKFKNYKAFYQYAQKDTLLDKYKSINLMFTQQVVCSK